MCLFRVVPVEYMMNLTDVDSMFPVMHAYGKRQNGVDKICFNENKAYCPSGYTLISVGNEFVFHIQNITDVFFENRTVVYRPYHHNSTMSEQIFAAADMNKVLVLYAFSDDSTLFIDGCNARIGPHGESDRGSEHHLRGCDHPGSSGRSDGLRSGHDRLRRRHGGSVLEVQAGQVAVSILLFWLFLFYVFVSNKQSRENTSRLV